MYTGSKPHPSLHNLSGIKLVCAILICLLFNGCATPGRKARFKNQGGGGGFTQPHGNPPQFHNPRKENPNGGGGHCPDCDKESHSDNSTPNNRRQEGGGCPDCQRGKRGNGTRNDSGTFSQHSSDGLSIVQLNCPVTRKPLDSMGGKIAVDVGGGKTIYVCCQGCVNTVKKDPNKYLKIVESNAKAKDLVTPKEYSSTSGLSNSKPKECTSCKKGGSDTSLNTAFLNMKEIGNGAGEQENLEKDSPLVNESRSPIQQESNGSHQALEKSGRSIADGVRVKNHPEIVVKYCYHCFEEDPDKGLENGGHPNKGRSVIRTLKKNLKVAGIKNVKWEPSEMWMDGGRLDITVDGKMIYTRYYQEPGKSAAVSIGYDDKKDDATLDPDFISELISKEITQG